MRGHSYLVDGFDTCLPENDHCDRCDNVKKFIMRASCGGLLQSDGIMMVKHNETNVP